MIRLWVDNEKIGKNDLSKYCAVLAKEFPFCDELNGMARQASAERAWSAISRFYDNCKKKIPGKKGFPQFQKDNRSVESHIPHFKYNTECHTLALALLSRNT